MKLLILISFLLTISLIQSQNNCNIYCFNQQTGAFTCNGNGCQSFQYNTQYAYNLSTVMCIGGGSNCYYQGNVSGVQPQPNVVTMIFCNTTFPGCSTCTGNATCNACYIGYYSALINNTTNNTNCALCANSVPGCLSCTGQNNCTSCVTPYQNLNGGCSNPQPPAGQPLICQGCMALLPGQNTAQYICNLLNCNGFTYNSSINTNTGSVNCIGGGTSCFYNPNTSSTNVITTMLFCNYTFTGCSSCSNGVNCSNCYSNYYSYTYDVLYQSTNCQLCSQAIPGCMTCSVQGSCGQCALSYLNVNGLCYTQSGKLVSGIDPYSSGGSTAAEIVMDVFIFLILIGVIYAAYLLFVKSKTPQSSSS